MHAAVEAAFPSSVGVDDGPLGELPPPVPPAPAPATSVAVGVERHEDARLLWRLDEADHRAVLYILSPSEPDCTHLVEQAGWPSRPHWDTRSYTPLLDRLSSGQLWAFRLTANPTKSIRIGDSERSQRVGHVTAAQQRDWFLHRTPGWGFHVPSTPGGDPAVLVTGRRVRTFRRGSTRAEISTAVFDGRLVVDDPETFRRALLRGLGPAKGYGCGLLTLARPPETP
jgi:CRISPR system Cascade subunit CasE